MSEIVQNYEDIVSIDKLIRALNQEITHINKTLKHYGQWMECSETYPEQTFLEYENALKYSYIDERTALIEKRKKIIERYQNLEDK